MDNTIAYTISVDFPWVVILIMAFFVYDVIKNYR